MNSLSRTSLCAGTTLALLFLGPAYGAILASENFEFATVGELNGQNSGTGFSISDNWLAQLGITEVVEPTTPFTAPQSGGARALEISGNNDNAIARDLAQPLTDDFYVSYQIRMTAGTINQNLFASLWLGQGVHIGAPSIGIKANEGPNDLDFMGRIDGLQEAYGNQQLQVSGTNNIFDYRLVARVSKDPNGANPNNFNTVDFWVNPDASDFGTPQATSTGNINASSISRIGFRTVNLNDDTFLVDNILIGTEWEDAFTVPEPSVSLIIALAGGLCSFRRSRTLARI